MNDQKSAVYFTGDISPVGLKAVYEALNRKPTGKTAVKISTGEPGNTHYLAPDLIKGLVKEMDGTIVEGNTAYPSQRATTDTHYQVAKDHGFTAIAPVLILDEQGDMSIPVAGGKHLKEDFVGNHFQDFKFHVVLSHFKGHTMGGFGGALKNMSIGYASPKGKINIHSAGSSTTGWVSAAQDDFLESMAEAAKAVVDAAGKENFIYINVMNFLSVDCDCDGHPAPPCMPDIGILASTDPVALDKACLDLVYASPDRADLVERIESRHGIITVDHAVEIGLGSTEYELVRLEE
jgi:uncharacterized Fe-S center protein